MKRPGLEPIQNGELGADEIDDPSEKKSSWHDKAECKDKDIDQMFGDPEEVGKDTVREQQRLARIALCGECEVEFECLEAAKREEKIGEDPREIGVYGVRGGMTESERREYYKRLRRAERRNKRRSVA